MTMSLFLVFFERLHVTSYRVLCAQFLSSIQYTQFLIYEFTSYRGKLSKPWAIVSPSTQTRKRCSRRCGCGGRWHLPSLHCWNGHRLGELVPLTYYRYFGFTGCQFLEEPFIDLWGLLTGLYVVLARLHKLHAVNVHIYSFSLGCKMH